MSQALLQTTGDMRDRQPPGPRNARYGLAHLDHLREDFLGFVTGLARQYGDCVRYRVGLVPVYQFTHPDQIQEVLVTKAKSFRKTDRLRRVLGRVLGNAMLLSEDDEWAEQRRLIQPEFHPQRLPCYADIIVRRTNELIDEHTGKDIDIGHTVSRLTLLTAGEMLFGADLSTVADQFIREVNDLQSLAYADFTARRIEPLSSGSKTVARMRCAVDFLVHVIQEIIDHRQSSSLGQSGLLSQLLASAKNGQNSDLTNQQIRDESLLLLLAAHATTATAITWSVYLLAKHLDVQQRVTQEVDRVLGERNTMGKDFGKLHLTEAVFQESLRLFPPVYTTARQTIESVRIGNYWLPAGAQVHLVPYITHHDARWFPEPQRFRPERFAANAVTQIPRFAFIPFGAGPRACIGGGLALMQGVAVLSTLLRRCRLSLSEGQTAPDLQPLISLQPKDRIQLRLSPRNG